MRNNGRRVPARELSARPPVRGWLQYKETTIDTYSPRWEAQLLEAQGGRSVIPTLYWARFRRIEGVMHLVGREDCGRGGKKASPLWRPQSWMCAFDPADAAPMLERLRLAALSAPYDPFEDDPDDHPIPLDWQ